MTLNYDCFYQISKHLKDLDHLNFCRLFNFKVDINNLTNTYYILNNVIELHYLKVELIQLVKRIKWKYICEDTELLQEFQDDFRDNYDWRAIYGETDICWFDVAEASIFSERFIEEFDKGDMIWYYICKKQKLSESFIRKYKDQVNWFAISRYQTLSDDFLKEFKDKIKWGILSSELSEQLIREFKDDVNWNRVCRKQSLSEAFIREFKAQVNWYLISCYQELSEEFIKEFKEFIHWDNISQCQDLSESFVKEFKDQIDWEHLSYNLKMPEKLIRKLIIWKYMLPVIPYVQMVQQSRFVRLCVLETRICNMLLIVVSYFFTKLHT